MASFKLTQGPVYIKLSKILIRGISKGFQEYASSGLLFEFVFKVNTKQTFQSF